MVEIHVSRFRPVLSKELYIIYRIFRVRYPIGTGTI